MKKILLCLTILVTFALSACRSQIPVTNLEENFQDDVKLESINATDYTKENIHVTDSNEENEIIVYREKIIEKELSVDGVTWRSISVGKDFALESDNPFESYDYEILRSDVSGDFSLVETFSMSSMYDIKWELFGRGIKVDYSVGGIEGVIKDEIIYDELGMERLRVEEEVPFDYDLSFILNDSENSYYVTWLTEEKCFKIQGQNVENPPSVAVIGVKVSYGEEEKDFFLDEPIESECRFFDGWGDPSMKIVEVNLENIKFTLPNGKEGVIRLNGEGFSGVEFL